MATVEPILIGMDTDVLPVEKKIKLLSKVLEKNLGQRLPIEANLMSLCKKLDEAKEKLKSLEIEDKKITDKQWEQSMQQGVSASNADEIQTAKEEIQRYKDEIKQTRAEIEKLDQITSSYADQIKSLKFTGNEDATNTQIVQQVKSGLEGAVQAAENLSEKMTEIIASESNVGTQTEKGLQEAEHAAEGITEELSKAAATSEIVGNKPTSKFKEATQGVKKYVIGVLDSIDKTTIWGKAVNKVRDETSQIWNGYKGGANALKSDINNGLNSALQAIKNFRKVSDKETDKAASGMKSKLGSALKSTGKSFDNFGKRIANTFKSAFVFSVLYAGLNQLKQRLSAMLSTNQQFSNSLTQVKSNLAVAFQPIYQAAMPAINALLNLLVKATAYLAAFTNALLGTSVDSSVDAAREMEKSINAVQSGASGATAAEKQLTAAIKEKQSQVKALQRENKKLQREYEAQKKAVEEQTKALEKQIDALNKQIDSIQASEDALNKVAEAQRNAIQANIDALQKQQDAISEESSAVRKEQEQAQKAVDEQKAAIDNQIKSINKQIKALQKKQKAEEKAKKENEKFTADFDELSTLGSVEADDPYDVEIEQLQEQIDILQERKEAIEDIDYSARLEALDAENEKIQEQIDLLQEQQDAIKDVDFSSSIDAYESQISSLNEKINELNDSVVENPLIEQNELLIEQLQEEINLLQEQKDAIQSGGTVINFDSTALTEMQKNLENLNDDLQKFVDFTDKVSEFIKVAAGLAAIGGIIGGVVYAVKNFGTVMSGLKTLLKTLTASKVGVFALVVAGLAAIVVAAGNGQEMIDNLKYTFEGFGKFLKGIFTGDLELAKEGIIQVTRGLIDTVVIIIESGLNLIIRGLNWLIEKINSIQFAVPDWVPSIGGQTLSPDLKPLTEISIPRCKIPALAHGTVIPPNKPFLAWLGDQTSGTNIEAPLSTIEDAFRNVVGEMDFNYNFTADGSLGALIRVLKLGLKREGKRETAFE